MAKKRMKKTLRRAGTSIAAAVAMSSVVSMQASAVEIDDILPVDIQTAKAAFDTFTSIVSEAIEPAETNAAIAASNEETVAENTATAEKNEQVEQDNNAAAENNEAATDGALENPNLELPDAPAAPDTDGLGAEDYNDAIGDYNEDVNDYNDAVEDYNQGVDDYNDAADAYDQQAQEKYEEDKSAYEEAKEQFEAAMEEFKEAVKDYTEKNTAYQDYLNKLKEYTEVTYPAYEKDYAEWLEAKGEHESSEELYQKYLEEKAAYDAKYDADKAAVDTTNAQKQEEYDAAMDVYNKENALYQDYLADLKEYNEVTHPEWEKAYDTWEEAEEAYQDYLIDKGIYDTEYEETKAAVDASNAQKQEEYDAAMDVYNAAYDLYQDYLADLKEYNEVTYPEWVEEHAAWADADKLYQDYLAAKAAYDVKYVEDKAAVDARNEAATAEYERLHALWEAAKAENATAKENYASEMSIYDLIVEYNGIITGKNADTTAKNDALDDDLHANVAESLGALTDKNDGVVPEAGVIDSLGVYDALMAEKEALSQEAAALAADERRDDGLSSDTYASYLADVEAHNNKVTAHNAKVDLYNEAVTLYNQAVDAYNEEREENSSSVGSTTDSGTADWGNINITDRTTFGHIDVKYTAAVTKDEDEDEDSASSYTVTGVYKDKATAEAEAGKDYPSYSLTYVNGSGQTGTQSLVKENTEFKGHNASIDPNDGSISFYVTLEDENGESHGISVTLDETSVYPANTYFNGTDNGKIASYRDSEGNSLASGEDGYDISGQSVFVVSALTCNGAKSGQNGTINTDGLDLVLNVETLIELHKADNAEKLSYMDYELGMTAQTEEPTDPGEFTDKEPTLELEDLIYDPPTPVDPPGDEPQEPNPPEPVDPPVKPELNLDEYPDYDPPEPVEDPGDAPEEPNPPDPVDEPDKPELNLDKYPDYDPPTPVEDPGDFDLEEPQEPTPPEPVEDPGDAPEEPDPFDQEEPAKPAPTERLDHAEPLEELEEKVIVEVVLPEIPDEPVEKDEPAAVPDEEVPLAKAPKTGDISGLWAVLSALSAGGIGFLNRKRKDEE